MTDNAQSEMFTTAAPEPVFCMGEIRAVNSAPWIFCGEVQMKDKDELQAPK